MLTTTKYYHFASVNWLLLVELTTLYLELATASLFVFYQQLKRHPLLLSP